MPTTSFSYTSRRYTGYRPAGVGGGNYFERHWHGDLSLGVSYWVNEVILGFVADVIENRSVGYLERVTGEQPLACFFFVAAVLVLLLGLQIWQVGGTWRSARRARQSGRAVRATIVQILLCFTVLGMVSGPIFRLKPILSAAADGRAVPVKGIVLREGGRVIEFNSHVDAVSAEQFRKILDASQPSVVRLESPGGLVVSGRAIAEMIRARGLDTEVSHICASACAFIFYAGKKRTILPGGKLGFHSYSNPQDTPQGILQAEAEEKQVYLTGGVSQAFVERIFNVPPAKIWFPTQQEAEESRFATPRGGE